MEGKINSTLLKRILLGMILTFMLLPLIQYKTQFMNEKPLEGAIENISSPQLASESWFSGSYQDTQTLYLNQNIGFRSKMVRTYNQWQFSLFNEVNAKNVVIGQDNYLYEENYIETFKGTDFRGKDSIRIQVEKLKLVADTLSKLGKHLVVLLAPGKGSFFPEFFPEKDLQELKKVKTLNPNLRHYAKQLKLSNINTLNLNDYFIQQKGKMKYPLFAKTGVHWSKYGEMVMADTLISYLNTLEGISLPSMIVDSFNVTDDVWDTDDDIEKGLNLLFNIQDNVMGYPYFHFEKKDAINYSKVLTIADSYFWGPYNWGMSKEVFSDGQFWYYNLMIYQSDREAVLVKEIDFQKGIEENDIILIEVTDANLFRFGFGFIEHAYETYFKK